MQFPKNKVLLIGATKKKNEIEWQKAIASKNLSQNFILSCQADIFPSSSTIELSRRHCSY